MLFNSLEFAVFFPLVAAAYFLLPHRFRWVLLLGASYGFYMAWKAEYALLLLLSTVVDYTAANGIQRATTPAGRRRWLLLSICTNLGILGFFKYFNFLNDTIRGLFGAAGLPYAVPDLDVLLPMGISFYTFQTMSYTIDVYRGNMVATRHPGRFALYVTFFPQLVAGPIERAPSLLPQFLQRVAFDPARIISGLKQMLWGFFKKLVIADRVAPIVDQVFADPGAMDWPSAVLGVVLLTAQIYCDFSGYSDIAIGAARLLGFRLMDNFRTPYLSASFREFWSRWHISLSTWFRDYLYLPLGGNRSGLARWYVNLMAVFLISGLWHGANWTLVAWGGLHGAFLIGEDLLRRAGVVPKEGASWHQGPFRRALGVGVTMLLLHLSLVLFRSTNIEQALQLYGILAQPAFGMDGLLALGGEGRMGAMVLTVVVTLVFMVVEPLLEPWAIGRRAFPSGWMAYLTNGVLLALILLLGAFGRVSFVYFQF